jgi:multidrug efflux pump subunit AcrA (membrane-fusion protein)
VLLPGGENAVFVPAAAVVRDKTTDSYQVYTADSGTAHLHVVVTGNTEGGLVRIMSGLNGTETVVTSHQSEMFDGALVSK